MAVSGRAGLFTIDDKFFYDLRGSPYTNEKRQNAYRVGFGKVTVPNATTTKVSAYTGINTGLMAVATPTKNPTTTSLVSGTSWSVATSGGFTSGYLTIDVKATGAFSGQASGMEINYIVIGYN